MSNVKSAGPVVVEAQGAIRTSRTPPRSRKLFRGLNHLSFIIPAGIMCAVFLCYPIVDTFWLSLHNVNEFGQVQGFDGLSNFAHVLRDPGFRGSLFRSAIWTVAVVVVTTALSLFVAVVVNQPWRGRG